MFNLSLILLSLRLKLPIPIFLAHLSYNKTGLNKWPGWNRELGIEYNRKSSASIHWNRTPLTRSIPLNNASMFFGPWATVLSEYKVELDNTVLHVWFPSFE